MIATVMPSRDILPDYPQKIVPQYTKKSKN